MLYPAELPARTRNLRGAGCYRLCILNAQPPALSGPGARFDRDGPRFPTGSRRAAQTWRAWTQHPRAAGHALPEAPDPDIPVEGELEAVLLETVSTLTAERGRLAEQ